MLTRVISRAQALVRSVLASTDKPNDVWLKNGTAATTVAIGDLLMLDRATVDSSFNYTQVILPTTAGIAGTAAQTFCVAQTAGGVGVPIRCRFEGDTLLKLTTNVAADTNLTGTNASVSAADAGTGNLIIGYSKEAGSGVKRCYFNGFGIAVSA